MEALSVEELCDYLIEKENLDEDLVDILRTNKIKGKTFIRLTEDHIKELFPVVGDRLELAGVVEKMKTKCKENHNSESPATTVASTSTLAMPSINNSHVTSNWVESFCIPARFSKPTIRAVDSGELSKSSRVEVVAAIAHQIIQKTWYPKSKEYNLICEKLISKYPNVKDSIGSGYGSWKQQIRQKMKNLRRDSGIKEDGDENDSNAEQPPAKKQRREDSINLEDFEANVEKLRDELAKPNPRSGAISSLMSETQPGRRQWIKEDNPPSVSEVLNMFPPLAEEKYLLNEMSGQLEDDSLSVHHLMDKWPATVQATLKHAKLEKGRQAVSSLLSMYQSLPEASRSEDCQGIFTLKLLTALLSRSKQHIVNVFKDTEPMNDIIDQVDVCTPYIVVVEPDDAENLQYFLVVEKQVYMECRKFSTALLCLFCVYYTFNISYPKPLYSVFIFVQTYVLGIKDGYTVPANVNSLITALRNQKP